MTKTTTVASKAFVAIVAAAMVFSLIAPAAKAATAEELQAQIAALMAQITALSGGTTTTTTTTTTSCVAIPAPLTMGAKGANVIALQNYLIAAKQSIPAGATGFFGGQTKAALAAFQSANGIMPAVGYYGPVTAAKMAAMCTPVTPAPGTTTPGTTTPGTSEALKGGEASLSNYKANSGDDSSVAEGDQGSVAEFKFDVDDADVKISRVDLTFVKTGSISGQETKPWKTFSTIKLMADGKEIASEDVSNKSDWLNDTAPYKFRFSDLNYVVRENDTAVITVEVEMADSVDGTASNDIGWTVAVGTAGIRGVDGENIDQTIGDAAKTVSFDVTAAGGDDELKVTSASSNPEATTLQLFTNKKSGWTEIFAFDLDSKNSTNDIQVNTLRIPVTLSTSTYAAVVRDARLMVGGKEVGNLTVGSGTSTVNLDFTFDTDEFTINSGDRETVSLELDFNQLALANEGITVKAVTSFTGLTGEGSDDIISANLTGSAAGKMHTLRTEGAIISGATKVTPVAVANDPALKSDNEGTFVVKFDVKAFQNDIFVKKSALRGTVLSGTGVNYTILDAGAAGAATTSGTISSATLTSNADNADTDATFFTVKTGESKTFTLTVTFNATANSSYQLQLNSLNFSATAGGTMTQQMTLPVETYQTDPLSILEN